MSTVLLMIIIPNREAEIELKEREKNIIKSNEKKLKKNLSAIINETINEEETVGGEESDNSLEKVVQNGIEYLKIEDAAWVKSLNGKFWHIEFVVDLQDSDFVIQYFKSRGVGLRLSSSIGIMQFSYFCYNEDLVELDNGVPETADPNQLNNFKERQGKFLKSVTARLTVAQIVNSVRTSAMVTFDFICYLVFASWIAAMGLLDDSVISLVASMLVSPMMGTVMALTFGTIIKDRSLRNMGGKNILVCLLVTILFGFLFGMIALNFTNQWDSQKPWPTNMMKERGLTRVVWVGTLVAFPSGCAVAISLLSGNDASLVGVAISVSLLPPAVNAGLLWAYSFLRFLYSLGQEPVPVLSQFDDHPTIHLRKAFIHHPKYAAVYSDNVSIETLFLGLLSLALSLINIANIIIGALLFLKIKEIAPLQTLSPESRRFFQEDIKIARKYNETSGLTNLEEDMIREWAVMNGLDEKKVLNPESLAVQVQTLKDLARDVEADEVYQTITKGINSPDNLARRLSQGLLAKKDRLYARRQTLAGLALNSMDRTRRPSHHFLHQGGGNRRRISTVALNELCEKENGNYKTFNGIGNPAFEFSESDINDHSRTIDESRRNSATVLARTLQTSEHSPLSIWPAARHDLDVEKDDDRPASPKSVNIKF